MNKKVLWAAAAVLVLGVGAWALSSGGKPAKSPGEAGRQSQNGSAPKLTSLKELMGLASPQKCVFSDASAAEKPSGTVYMSKGKVRGDFEMTAEGKLVKSHMITDDKYSYTWMDGMSSGFKVSLAEPETAESEKYRGLDEDKQINYECSAWQEDSKMFSLPSGVAFQDFAEMFKSQLPAQPAQAGGDPSQAACAACDSLQGEARTQCRAAMSCK